LSSWNFNPLLFEFLVNHITGETTQNFWESQIAAWATFISLDTISSATSIERYNATTRKTLITIKLLGIPDNTPSVLKEY